MKLDAAFMIAALALGASVGWSQSADTVPAELEDVGITEHLEARVPLDLTFRNEAGETVPLSRYFTPGRPVILTLNYYECPMLCTLQLNGLVEGMKGLSWSPGAEYELVTVSINPLETPELAAAKKKSYLASLERPSAAAGWHFLVGTPEHIRRLTETVGFRYKRDPETGQFAHVAALMLLAPDGTIARYLYGIEYPPKKLKLGLLEASEGKIGSTIDRIILYCHRYDPKTRHYTPVAMNIMRVGGGATLLLLALVLVPAWVRGRRRAGRTGSVQP